MLTSHTPVFLDLWDAKLILHDTLALWDGKVTHFSTSNSLDFRVFGTPASLPLLPLSASSSRYQRSADSPAFSTPSFQRFWF